MSHVHQHRPADRSGRSQRLLRTVIATLVVLGVGLAVAPLASATPAPAGAGWIRIGHLSAGTTGVDVRLSPFAGGGPIDLTDIVYGEVSDYSKVPEGLYTVAVRPAGSAMTVTPMIDETVEVTDGGATTLIATTSGDRVVSRVVQDDLTPPARGEAKVRLISGAGDDEVVTARVVDGPVLADEVTPGSDTAYASVAAQTWAIEVSGDGTEPRVDRVSLEPGGIYTLLVVDAPDSGLSLKAVQDSASAPVMPRGGVDTGGGGLAAEAGSSGVSGFTTALAGGLTLLGGLVLLARRRRAGAAG